MRRPPRHRLLPTSAAALAAGVSEATIRKWVSRGKITRYGTPGRSQFDIDEIMQIVMRRGPRPARAGGLAPGSGPRQDAHAAPPPGGSGRDSARSVSGPAAPA